MVKQMAVKRTEYPHTGIYPRKVSQIDLRLNEEGYRDLTELLAGGHQNDPLGLNAMESKAIGVINAYAQTEMCASSESLSLGSIEWAVQEDVTQKQEKLHAELQNHLSQEKKRELTRKFQNLDGAADACEILDLIHGVRLHLQTEPAARSALETGILLGRAYGRLTARVHEPSALTGRRILQGASEGGRARKKDPKLNERLVARFRASGLSKRRFAKLNPQYSLSTLERAIRAARKVDSNRSK
jgi:hypothetical protein